MPSLYDRKWRKRRAAQLRAHPLCRMCAENDAKITLATVADHVTPHRGDSVLFAGPLQSLCDSCHSSRKQALEHGGFLKGCDLDGIPVDPNHPWRIAAERDRSDGGEGATLT
jgi:5-methylcytosine-specific restriction enzyme A